MCAYYLASVIDHVALIQICSSTTATVSHVSELTLPVSVVYTIAKKEYNTFPNQQLF